MSYYEIAIFCGRHKLTVVQSHLSKLHFNDDLHRPKRTTFTKFLTPISVFRNESTQFAAMIYYRKTLFGRGPKLTEVHIDLVIFNVFNLVVFIFESIKY